MCDTPTWKTMVGVKRIGEDELELELPAWRAQPFTMRRDALEPAAVELLERHDRVFVHANLHAATVDELGFERWTAPSTPPSEVVVRRRWLVRLLDVRDGEAVSTFAVDDRILGQTVLSGDPDDLLRADVRDVQSLTFEDEVSGEHIAFDAPTVRALQAALESLVVNDADRWLEEQASGVRTITSRRARSLLHRLEKSTRPC